MRFGFRTKTVIRNHEFVKENSEMDKLRKTQCLCLNCARMYHCTLACEFYEICVRKNMALMITRCPIFVDKNKE